MKRYKLVKDLPTFKAGETFELWDSIETQGLCRESDGVMAYHQKTLDKFPNILTDWFEEIKEPTRWKPEKYDEPYYFINALGMVGDDTWRDSVSVDREKFNLGNIFQTKEEAERVVEYLKALAVVKGDATVEFIKGKSNYYVVYNTTYNCLDVSDNCYLIKNGIFGLPYFATEEDARRSIEQHKSEWLTIFGIEEE